MYRIATISAKESPLARLGGKETGGMNVYVREFSRELGRQGHRVDIFTRRRAARDPDVVEMAPNVRVVHLDCGPTGDLDKTAFFQHLPEFLTNLRRFRQTQGLDYDLLHSHYWLSGWAAGFLQQRWGVPHVSMFHTLGLLKNRARVGENEAPLRIETERRLCATASQIVVASPHERSQLLRHYEAPAARVSVIPCGVDLERFRPRPKAAARAELGLTTRRALVFVGRPDPIKGIDILLRAVARLDEREEITTLIVGGTSARDKLMSELKRLARELGIAQQVRFVGAVPQERLPLYYSAADLCVVPSYYESFGFAAVEALACGTPVVASRVGGLPTTVRDGETGYLVPWRCPEPFAERLELLLENDALREQFAQAARPSVERFSWPAVAAEMLDLYADLLGGAARRVGAPS